MATVRSIIADALMEIGVLSQGEAMSAGDAALGLLRFRNMVDAWQADRLTLTFQQRLEFTATAGTNTYSVGPGGDIDITRPMWIPTANYLVPGSNPSVEAPLGPMDQDSYANLSIKSLSSNLPQQFFYQSSANTADASLGSLFLYPTVSQDVTIALYFPATAGILSVDTLETIIGGPPGYQEAFMYQLALRLCNPFGRPIPPALPQMSIEATARMKRPNIQPGLLGVDQALIPTYGSAYNVLTDNSSSAGNR